MLSLLGILDSARSSASVFSTVSHDEGSEGIDGNNEINKSLGSIDSPNTKVTITESFA
jgi:hypothetical protein